MPEVSVVLPTYNRKALLRECLLYLFWQDFDSNNYEIIVVDDGSSDGTHEAVGELINKYEIPNIVYVRQANKGVASACNLGIAQAQGSIIVFTEDDCVIPSDWIKKIVHYHALNTDIAVIQGRALNFYKNSLFACLEQEIWDGHWERIVRTIDGRKFLSEILTGNCSFKSRIFSEYKLLFREIFLASEETDLALRILERGERILYEADIAVFHKHRRKVGSFVKRVFRDGRGEVILQRTWRNSKDRFSSKAFGVPFFIDMSKRYIKRYPLRKSLVLIGLCMFRKIIKSLGRLYQYTHMFLSLGKHCRP